MELLSLLAHPFCSTLFLVTLIFALKWELSVPGKWFPLMLALASALLFALPLSVVGLASNWELMALLAAVVLMLLEVFVFPGFGLAGILSIVLGLGGLLLCQLPNDGANFDGVSMDQWLQASSVVGIACLVAGAMLVAVSSKLANHPIMKGVAQLHELKASKGYVSHDLPQLDGADATTLTVLRPSGKVIVNGQTYDAISSGPMLDAGITVKVLGTSGGMLKVG